MKIAVVGSRNLSPCEAQLASYLAEADEIVSGGAKGVDACAAKFAKDNGIKLTEFLPKYELYGRAAPIVRNKEIVDYADKVIVFWNGSSKGTLSVIKYAEKAKKPAKLLLHPRHNVYIRAKKTARASASSLFSLILFPRSHACLWCLRRPS